jgi:peptide/nickel transport system ATP-binding protein
MTAAPTAASEHAAPSLVRVEGLTVDFATDRQKVRAVAGVDLSLERGEVLAILGESGSGKSVTLRSLLRLLPRTAVIGGSIHVDGTDVLAIKDADLPAFRGTAVSMIFQEPGLAFDPVFRIGNQIAEAIMSHEGVSQREAIARALNLFERVRIPAARQRLESYPHEMSGGMRQRAMIALALACRPKVLLADEPTTALDATVQIQILLLLKELRQEFGLAIIFVTHDIGVAVEVADRIAVMYAGRIVESGSCASLIGNPQHPYTQGLLATRTGYERARGSRLTAIPGAPPDLANLPPGCAFAPRCTRADQDCRAGVPPQVDFSEGHWARCIRMIGTAQ